MKRGLLVGMLVIAAGASVLAETPQQNVAKGFSVDKSYELKDLGSISTFNGNLGVTIPIGMRYQVSSALSYQLMLTYGGNVWKFEATQTDGNWDPVNNEIPQVTVEWAHPGNITMERVVRNVNAGLGWNLTLGYLEPDNHNAYVSPDGARHIFWSKLNDQTVQSPGVDYTRDGTYLRRTTSEDGLVQIEFPDGTRHRFDPVTGRIKLMLDRFGNQVTVKYAPGLNCATDPADCAEDWTIGDGFRSHKVDLQRFPASGTGSDSYAFDVVKSVTFSLGTSDAATYTFAYAPNGSTDALLTVSRQIAKRQNCEVAPYILAAVLHSVTLPDGSKWEITTDRGHAATVTDPAQIMYTSVDGQEQSLFTNQDCHGDFPVAVWTTPSVSGHLTKIKRPTGATTEWTYQRYSFPPYVSSLSDCAGVGVTNCRFAISARDAVGVKERKDYGRSSASIPLSKTTYAQSTPDSNLTRITTVTTYDDLSTTPAPVSTSEHFYTTHHTFSDPKRPDYGLPFTDESIGLPASLETANPDSGGRYLSSKTYAGTTGGTLLSYTFVKYEGETSGNADDASTVNRRIVSERTVHLAADGSIANEVIHTYSDFDGLGHFRTARTTTGRNSSPVIDRTVTTKYNKPDASTGSLNETSSAWILNTYSSVIASENSTNADGLLERKSMKTLFLFDRDTGFLKRRRTLKTIASEVRPASAPVTDPPFTTDPAVPVHANDLIVEFGHTAGNVTAEAYHGGDNQSVGTASLATVALPAPELSMTHTYSSGALATSQYAGIGFKSVDRTINPATGLVSSSRDPAGVETKYEYDWAGRLTFSAPGGSAATTYVFATPATGPSTATIKQRNGSSRTSSVMTTAVVEYDDLGRVWREKRMMPPNGIYSVRETLYNGRGLVASVSEWASEEQPDDLARKTIFTYDALGRVLTATTPDAKQTKHVYGGRRTIDRKSSVATSASSEQEVTTTETSDDLGRLVQVKEPNGTITAYTYDVGGKLASVTVNGAARQKPRTFTYDGRGFLTAERHPETQPDPESPSTTYTYDARGHVTARRAASVTSFAYDAAERLIQVNEGSLPLKVFTFDRPNSTAGTIVDRSMGKLATAKRHNRGTPAGDLTVTETFYYKNDAGRLSQKETTLSTGETFKDSYVYDRLGAPVSISYPTCLTSCGPFTGPTRTVTNGYSFGLLTDVTHYGSIAYAPSGMVTSVTHKKADGTGGPVDTYAVDDATGMARPANITFGSFCNDLSVSDLADRTAVKDTTVQIPVTAVNATSYQLFKVTASGADPVGSPTTSATLSVFVTATAQYFVRVGNGTCTVDSRNFTITVDTCPAPPSTLSVSPSTVPRNGTGTASVPVTSNATYAWTIEGGTITSPTPWGATISFRPDCDAASVTVSVQVTASCGTSGPAASQTVPTGPATTATLSVSGSATINQGGSKTINVALTGTAGWTLSWSPSAPSCAATASSFTCSASPAGTTTYVLTATDANGCTAVSNPLTITVVPPAPFGLSAVAISATSVQLGWGLDGSADTFEIERRAAGGSFLPNGSASTLGTVVAASSNAAYLYRVRAVKSGTPSGWSNVDLATTVIFTDDPLAPGVVIRAQHIVELRTAVNAVRALWSNSLGAFAFTDPLLTGVRLKAAHVQELRDVLNEARAGLALGGVTFTDPLLTGLAAKAVHVNELRGGVR